MGSPTIEPPPKSPLRTYINQRWDQLYNLEKDAAHAAFHYLFMANTGGAAATLAFIGAVGRDRIGAAGKTALVLFVIGVIVSGVSRARYFHWVSALFWNWKKLVQELEAGSKTWEVVVFADTQKSKPGFWDYAIPYFSFACFIAGAIVGCLALL